MSGLEKRYDYITPKDYITAESNGITERTVYQRVNTSGWDIDRAISEPMRPKGESFVHVWAEWQQVALGNGINRDQFYGRLRQCEWSAEKAATTPTVKGSKSDKWTEKEIATAERNGVAGNSMGLVSTRINQRGWSREEALNTPKLSRAEQKKRIAEGTRKYHREREDDHATKNVYGMQHTSSTEKW